MAEREYVFPESEQPGNRRREVVVKRRRGETLGSPQREEREHFRECARLRAFWSRKNVATLENDALVASHVSGCKRAGAMLFNLSKEERSRSKHRTGEDSHSIPTRSSISSVSLGYHGACTSIIDGQALHLGHDEPLVPLGGSSTIRGYTCLYVGEDTLDVMDFEIWTTGAITQRSGPQTSQRQ